MSYDPFKHHRRSIRLRGYDYTQAGAYFCTIVTRNRECVFGDVVDGEMRVNEVGKVVVECWDALPAHFPNVELDAFVVMPNHIHAIIVLATSHDGRGNVQPRKGEASLSRVVAQPEITMLHPYSQHNQPNGTQSGSISAIIQNFKSVSSRRINVSRNTAGTTVWHRNYYEHIIRTEKSLEAIRKYIEGNPANWANDEDNPVNIR